jgi:hypothetical protein
MAQPASIERRLAALKKRVAELSAEQSGAIRQPDWRSTIGMFTGDEIVRQAFKGALRLREANRRRTRHGSGQSRRAGT